jgi:hypothetical protein
MPIDSIKTEYHLHSGRPTRIEKFEDYRERTVMDIPSFSLAPVSVKN